MNNCLIRELRNLNVHQIHFTKETIFTVMLGQCMMGLEADIRPAAVRGSDDILEAGD